MCVSIHQEVSASHIFKKLCYLVNHEHDLLSCKTAPVFSVYVSKYDEIT